MQRVMFLLGLCALFGLTGCCATQGARGKVVPTIRMTGMVTSPAGGQAPRLIDLNDITVDGESLMQEIPPRVRMRTWHNLRLTVDYLPDYEYIVFFGPPLDRSHIAEGMIVNSAPSVHLWYGWVYLTGRRPMAATPYVAAGADGSTLVVQIDEEKDKSIHRVYFLEGKEGWAESVMTGERVTLTDLRTYVEVTEDGSISDPKNIVPGSMVAEFIGKVEAIAAASP